MENPLPARWLRNALTSAAARPEAFFIPPPSPLPVTQYSFRSPRQSRSQAAAPSAASAAPSALRRTCLKYTMYWRAGADMNDAGMNYA